MRMCEVALGRQPVPGVVARVGVCGVAWEWDILSDALLIAI
jgi:hypothetical protein